MVDPAHVTLAPLVAALAALSAVARGQELAWKLDRRSVVEYGRKLESDFLATKLRSGKSPASDTLRGDLGLSTLHNPPLLYEAELDSKKQCSTETPTVFWDIIPFVALDLGTRPGGNRLLYDLPRIRPFGDLSLKGKASAIDAAGKQELTLTLQSRPPAERDGPKQYFKANIADHYTHEFRGRLKITRQIDGAAGRVVGFAAELTGEFGYPRKSDIQKVRVTVTDDWQLKKVHPYRDAAFRTAVDEAIKSGAKYLLGRLGELGHDHLRKDAPPEKGKLADARSYNSGRLALSVLTLLKAEVDRKDPVLRAAMQELRRRVIHDTYSLGLAIMAIEAYYAPPGERDDLIRGLIAKPRPRRPSPEDSALLKEWSRQILGNKDTRMDRGYRLAFNYTGGPRYDHSVNQYGLLGLYSAHLCGVEIPASVWIGAARHLVDEQRKEHYKPVPYAVLFYRDQNKPVGAAPRTGAQKAPGKVMPMGWSYTGKLSIGRLANGSMTTAGLSGLTICAAGLRDLDMDDHEILPELRLARQRGFAFLGQTFSVRANCGYPPLYDSHRLYYLYGLERACELSGVAEVAGRDWYHEGAMQLLAWQNKNGSFPGGGPLEATSFSVLFLKKAALPVYSGR